MFNNILIIGCGMIGSSILRGAISQKICKNIYVFEKNKKYRNQIKKINKKIIIIKKLDKKIEKMNLVVISTPMSEYYQFIIKLNNFLSHKSLITDVGSTRSNVSKLIKQKLSKKLNWIMSHPIAGSEASGPKYGSQNLFKNKWCILIKNKTKKSLETKLVRFWKKLGSKIILMNIPENLKYTKDHEWVSIDGETATVGITHFAQSELGDIVYVEIETLGEKLEREAVFGTVEAVKTVSDLFLPLTGEIIEFNADLESEPEAVNEDPYGKGWMIKIKFSDESELETLLDASAYQEIIGG